MKGLVILALAGCCLALPVAAQNASAGAAAAATAQQAANPLSTWLRRAYMNNRDNIVRSADKMPEEFYGLRPGPQLEVRTFGQHLGHLTDYNYLWCSQAKGEKNPNAGKNLEQLATKAELMKALT